jgi:NAD(P)-dependent dehydrogenase (short-subunit alcohol dehydrogenase family)
MMKSCPSVRPISRVSWRPFWRPDLKILIQKNGTGLDDQIAKIISQSPQQRLVQPNEIGELVAYLCRDEAAPITMEDIQVNAAAWW